MRRDALVGGLVGVALLVAVGASGATLGRLDERRAADGELLYLPNGKMLRALSLGQAPILADLFYLWAIQHYADYERSDRHRYVEHVFGNVIAELDPQYVDAYWLGALILITENHDLDAGLRLLDAGFEANPDRWVLPYVAAWECYLAGRVELARDYFDRAAAVPAAPSAVLRMKAGVTARSGDLEHGLALWREVLVDPRSDAESVAIARRQIDELETRIATRSLYRAIEGFRNATGRIPAGWNELLARGYIEAVPVDSSGRPFVYDPSRGAVLAPTGRVLGDSR